MEVMSLLFILAILLLFAGLVYSTVISTRRNRDGKMQMAQLLGLTPVQPDADLCEKIAALQRTSWNTTNYELRHVFRRPLSGGEMFLFDLVDASSEGDSWSCSQAVAIRSPALRLPPFELFPKVDSQNYALGGLANKIVAWVAAKSGQPVGFPEFPEFAARYVVTSGDPEATRYFFDERMAGYFAQTAHYSLQADDELFVFAEIEPGFDTSDQTLMARRLARAQEIFRLWQT
jgi:hypothetical protein